MGRIECRLDLMTHDADFEGLEDIVFIDPHSRTVFGRFCRFFDRASERRWNAPHEDAIRQARVVGLDPFFFDESTAVARLCSKHEVEFVTIDCKHDTDTHRLSTVNVLAEEYLRIQYPQRDLESLFADYASRTSGLVVFTFGPGELWFGRKGEEIQRFAPYRVEVQSTLGAGDSFKAGAIYALSRGMDDATLIRFASATAAAACMHYPIAENPPTLERITDVAGQSFEGAG